MEARCEIWGSHNVYTIQFDSPSIAAFITEITRRIPLPTVHLLGASRCILILYKIKFSSVMWTSFGHARQVTVSQSVRRKAALEKHTVIWRTARVSGSIGLCAIAHSGLYTLIFGMCVFFFSLCWQVSRTDKITEIGHTTMCLTCTTSYFQNVDIISVPTKRPRSQISPRTKVSIHKCLLRVWG